METITIIYFVMFFFGIYFLTLFLLIFYKNHKKMYDYPEPKKFPSISFLVPAYNEELNIANTIKALLEVEYPKDKKQIIVINDGSTDNTRKIVEDFVKKYPEVKLINKENSGKADSLNQAIKQVNTDLIAVTDADSYPKKDALLKMVGFFEQDEKVAAVTSRVLVKNKKNLLEKFQDVDYIVIAWTRKLLDYVDSVYVTNGPLSVYRTSAVKKVGGFDPKNLTEDIEITWHLLSQGYKSKMSYSAEVYTTTPYKFKNWMNQRIRWNLGGLQTIFKYKKYALREGLFGYFVITYVSLSFFLALIGLLLFSRFVWLQFIQHSLLIPYIFRSYNPLEFIEWNFSITILALLGLIFFILSYFYYKSAIKDSSLSHKNLFTILSYAFIYRPFYTIPLLISIYRLIKGDIRWYTK